MLSLQVSFLLLSFYPSTCTTCMERRQEPARPDDEYQESIMRSSLALAKFPSREDAIGMSPEIKTVWCVLKQCSHGSFLPLLIWYLY